MIQILHFCGTTPEFLAEVYVFLKWLFLAIYPKQGQQVCVVRFQHFQPGVWARTNSVKLTISGPVQYLGVEGLSYSWWLRVIESLPESESATCSHYARRQVWISPELISSRSLSVLQGLHQPLPSRWKLFVLHLQRLQLWEGFTGTAPQQCCAASSAVGWQLQSCVVQSPGEEEQGDFACCRGVLILYCWILFRCRRLSSYTIASGLTSFVDTECSCSWNRVNTLSVVYLVNWPLLSTATEIKCPSVLPPTP